MEEKGKEVAIQQLRHLERNMWLISVAAHVAPLVGLLLGTVTGMIKAFKRLHCMEQEILPYWRKEFRKLCIRQQEDFL